MKLLMKKDENDTAPLATKLASEGKVKIIVKGHIHTDVLMKAVFKKKFKFNWKKKTKSCLAYDNRY